MDLTGAIDLHVHTGPDVYARCVDDNQLVREAEAMGMAAVLLKSHHTLTADRATLAGHRRQKLCVFGGLALNHPVGGLNPIAVETALAFGAKQIWMPTLHARHCLRTAEQPMFRAEAQKGRAGITVLDDEGELLPVVRTILEQVRDADAILGTGHLAPTESLLLLREARAMGLTRLLVTHPNMSLTRFSLPQMHAAAQLGATLELDYLACCDTWPGHDPPEQTARIIQAVGHEHCVLASDGGQQVNPHPPVMLRQFAEAMEHCGITPAQLRLMMCDTPARLLGV